MAEISFEALAQENSFSDSSSIDFFNLKNNNDEAIVRFMLDSNKDFKILSTHDVQVNGKFRKANCLRSNGLEPLENCPLCASGHAIKQRFYITLIQYVADPNTGKVIPQPKVWERSIGYASTLNSYIENYGPLSDILCKVIRHGNAGDMKTRYEIIPNLNKMVYPDELYPKLAGVFDNYSPLGRIVLDKNFSELDTYVHTGAFPQTLNVSNENTIVYDQSMYSQTGYVQSQQPVYRPETVQQPSVEGIPWSSVATPTPGLSNNVPWASATQQVDRPVRG